MKNFNLTALVIIILLASCSKKDEQIQTIVIDNKEIPKTLDISNSIKKIELIELKEVSGSYLGGIWKLFIIDSNIIAYDRFQTHKVNLFKSNGEFIKTIIKTGDGPQDAFQINDCFINSEGNLEAYDLAAKRIYKYDKDFNLKNIQKFTESNIYKSVLQTGKGYITFAAFNEFNPKENGKFYHFAFLDDKFNIKSTALNFDKKFLGIDWLVFKNSFFRYGDSVRFLQAYDPFIYNVNQNSVAKQFRISYKERPLSENLLEDVVSQHIGKFKDRELAPAEQEKYFKGYTSLEGTWLENNTMIYMLSRNFDGYPFVTLVDKSKGFGTKSAMLLSESKKYNFSLPYFEFYDKKSNSFYSALSGKDLLKYYINSSCVFYKKIKDNAEVLYVIKAQFK